MAKFAVKYALLFVLLTVAQAVVFNRLILFGVAVPFVFLYLIVSLPITLGTNLSTLLGFLVGTSIDIFSDTPGLNALCCTSLAFCRKPIFHLYVSYDDDLAGHTPGVLSMGLPAYFKYLLTMVTAYCIMEFGIEAFQLFNIELLVMRIVASSLYTVVILYAIDCLKPRHRQ